MNLVLLRLEPLEFWVWLLIAMGILMVIMAIIGIIAYRRAQFEAELKAMNWLIRWEDVSATMAADEEEKVDLGGRRIIYKVERFLF